MIHLPAGVTRTTATLRRGGWIAGSVAAGLTAAAVGLHVGGHMTAGPGALYAAIGISAVAAATLITNAHGRSLSTTATTAVAAELAEQRETLRQVVAELARLRDHHRATDPTIGLDPESIEAARAIARRLLDQT